MKSPFYNILLGTEDISDFISDFSYDDCLEKDSLLTIRIHPKNALEFLNRKDVTVNADLKFKFGFLQGQMSQPQLAKIQDIDAKYDQNGIQVTLKALDAGHYLKKNSNNKVFKNKTSSEIASEIANDRGISSDIDSTTEKWENMPQGNLSDLHFLKKLCNLEDDYVCYIRSGTLYFKKRGLDSESKITYTYGEDDRVISFAPKQRTTGREGSNSTVKLTQTNPYTGESNLNILKTEEQEKPKVLNNKSYNYDANGNPLNTTVKKDPGRSKTMVKQTQNKNEAKNISNNMNKKENLNSNEATLIIEGNPLLEPKEIITMKGVAKRHSGNWQIVEVKHRISGSGFTTSLELKTNGTNDAGNIGKTPKKGSTNKSIGPDKKSNTKKIPTKKPKVYNYDVNANEK